MKEEMIPRKFIEEKIEEYRNENRNTLQMVADGTLSIEKFKSHYQSKYIYNVRCIDGLRDLLLLWDYPESKKWQRWKKENENENGIDN